MGVMVQAGPGQYIHGVDTLAELGSQCRLRGFRTLLIVTGQKSYAAVASRLPDILRTAGLRWECVPYSGECSDEDALRILSVAGPRWDAVMGIGGGKVLDLTKVVSQALRVPCITVPTVISNCAATTPKAIVYTPEGRMKAGRVYAAPPILTIVDDAILLESPDRYFASGLGDTLVKPYEASVGPGNREVLWGQAGITLAEIAAEKIRHHGALALRLLRAREPAPVVTDLIDVVILFGSMVGGIGGERCRGAAAHALHDALTILPELHGTLHGEKVAYGLMVQEAMLGRSQRELQELRDLLKALSLPYSWRTLTGGGALPEAARLQPIVEAACRSSLMHLMPGPPGPHAVLESMRQVEQTGGSEKAS